MKKYSKEFRLSTAEQRSPIWYKERAGIPSASGLGFLFDTLADGYTPSAKAKAYLKQLAFERRFGVTYEKFDTKAMQDGRFYEDFAKLVYSRETGNKLEPAYSYVSDWFIATPDAIVWEGKTKGLLECKIVGDKTFLEFMEDDIPVAHTLQTQGQLMASGLDWVDYIIVNLKTRAYYIRRIYRNNKLIKRIYERLHEPLDLPELGGTDFKRFDDNLLTDYIEGSGVASLPPEPDDKIELPFWGGNMKIQVTYTPSVYPLGTTDGSQYTIKPII